MSTAEQHHFVSSKVFHMHYQITACRPCLRLKGIISLSAQVPKLAIEFREVVLKISPSATKPLNTNREGIQIT